MSTRKLHVLDKQSAFNKDVNSLMGNLLQVLNYVAAASLWLLPLLFSYLNNLQFHYFIDEKFHIPQTFKYCKGEFYDWDPKITTLPGLYLFSAMVLGPLDACTITNLRLVNVICTYLNLLLSYALFTVLRERFKTLSEENSRSCSLFLRAWNIAFFPPLFFWFFLYYTDSFSVTLILLMFLFHAYDRNILAALIGGLSICVRQTNVIWVIFLGIEKGLTVIEEITKKPNYTDTLNLIPCIKTLYNLFQAKAKQGIRSFLKYLVLVCKPIFPYLLIFICFIIFVIYNGSIVVGDRTAHVPTIHVTQIYYYAVFSLGFSWPYLLPYLYKFLQFTRKNLIISSCSMCLIAITIHYNTLVHPYILADNRHYSFYIWKNLMNRYVYFKYLLVPIYAFAIYAVLLSLSHLRLLSVVAYGLCVCTVLIPQLLLEPRYFIIPYIFFRMHQKEPENWQIVGETLTTIFVNAAQFLIFSYKSFKWDDEEHLQRISW